MLNLLDNIQQSGSVRAGFLYKIFNRGRR